MRQLNAPAGTPLEGSNVVDEHHAEKLRLLGVTTVEGLFGLIRSNPKATSQFLEVSNLAELQNESVTRANPQLIAAMDEVSGPVFGLGALPPEGVEVEEEATNWKFDEYVAELALDSQETNGREGVDLIACFGPVRDQGRRGTCVAHAVVAICECLLKRQGAPLELSEQWLYYLCKERDGKPDDGGTWIDIAVENTIDDGVCIEEIWPYNPNPVPGNEGQGPAPPPAAPDAEKRKMTHFDELEYRSTDAIKAALDEQAPVAIAVPVYDNWYSNPAVNATGEISMPLPLSLLEGGHAMCIVGYDYDDRVPGGAGFIVRNSWGTIWAQQSAIAPGYGVLPFPYVTQYGWGAFRVN